CDAHARMSVERGADPLAVATLPEDLLRHRGIRLATVTALLVEAVERVGRGVELLEQHECDRVRDDREHDVRRLDRLARRGREMRSDLNAGADDRERAAAAHAGYGLTETLIQVMRLGAPS